MSDTAFADDTGLTEAEVDDIEDLDYDHEAEEADSEADGAEEDAAPPAKDWRKIAEDKDGALARERSRRRSEARRARELEERLAAMENRQQSSSASEDALERLAAALRDDDDDPIGDINGLKAVVKQFLQENRQSEEAAKAAQAQRRQIETIQTRMSEAETEFAEDHPDYHDAAKFFRAKRQEELEDLGYAGQQLQSELAKDLFGIVTRAMQGGRDPAEAVYNLAKKRGFSTQEATKKLSTIAAAQRGARGVGSAPARGPSGGLTPEAVGNLKGAAFDKAFAAMRKQQRRG